MQCTFCDKISHKLHDFKLIVTEYRLTRSIDNSNGIIKKWLILNDCNQINLTVFDCWENAVNSLRLWFGVLSLFVTVSVCYFVYTRHTLFHGMLKGKEHKISQHVTRILFVMDQLSKLSNFSFSLVTFVAHVLAFINRCCFGVYSVRNCCEINQNNDTKRSPNQPESNKKK